MLHCLLCFLVFPWIGSAAMAPMKHDVLAVYAYERETLSQNEIDSILDRGIQLEAKTTLTETLLNQGTALFPHAYIKMCGDQTAAVVHACLQACQKGQKKQILLIGVLHALTPTLTKARQHEIKGENVSKNPCRGIFGPGLPQEDILSLEFSLDNFLFLLTHASKRMHMDTPKVIIRYPNLVAGHPETLNSIEEIKQLANESIVVATSDLCHHGVAYGESLETAFGHTEAGLNFARFKIESGLNLLSNIDYIAYRDYCVKSLSDSKDVGQLLNYLLGPLESHIHDLRLVDVSELFEGHPQPSWVAATLVELKRIILLDDLKANR